MAPQGQLEGLRRQVPGACGQLIPVNLILKGAGTSGCEGKLGVALERGSALSRLGAELELRRSGSSLGPSQ